MVPGADAAEDDDSDGGDDRVAGINTEEIEAAELIPNNGNPRATTQRQNGTFRVYGLAALVLGIVGFAPSITKALLTGTPWSVSHDATHTDNAFLGVHAVAAAIWTLACIVQLCTGGVPKHAVVHRICGYAGSAGLLLAMVLATANELKYATRETILGNIYTLVLVLGASINMLVAVVRARQRRFPEHKDGMLLAIMFTLDPAVHRLAMWTIRIIASIVSGKKMTDPTTVDPGQLLILGKMPANFILFVVFGCMFVHSRRVSKVTLLCTSFNLVAFVGGAILAFSDGAVTATVRGLALTGTVAIMGIAAAFVVVEKRKRRQESE